MSIYFDSKIVIPEGGNNNANYTFGKRLFLDIEWHTEHQLLAISHSDESNGACVSIYDNLKEETVNIDSSPQQGIQITTIKWHPKGQILALGYETGEVIIWNHEEGEVFEGSRSHNSSIMLMEWSNDGGLLVSSDNMGILIIWKSDSQGHLQTHFIHDFKDPVCHIVFRQPTQLPGKTRNDDADRALGMMTTWRPKTGRDRSRSDRSGRQTPRAVEEIPEEKCFFVGVLSGTIYYLKESGSNEEILSSGTSIRSLLFYWPKEMLIILTEAQIMGHFRVSGDGDLEEINKMKVGGRGDMRLFWVGTNTLAVIGTRDPTVRLWDVDSAVNSVLEAKPSEIGDDESFLSLDYHTKDGILCCCTNKGKLIMWKEVDPPFSEVGECRLTEDGHWEPMSATLIPTSSKCAKWCPSTSGVLAVNALQDIMLLKEQELCFHFGHQVSVVQTQPSTLSVQLLSQKKSFDIKVDMQIKGVTASASHVVFWNGNKVVTYEFGTQVPNNYKPVGSFSNKSDEIIIQEMSLYMQELGQIQIRTFQGTVKQTLAFTMNEGPPITLAIGGDYLTSGSEHGYIKIWHIGRREAKLHTSPKNLNDHIDKLGEIMSANTNCIGTKIGFTVAKINLVPDSRLYIMDLSTNIIQEINFPSQFVEKFFWEVENPSYIALEVRNLSKELQTILDNESFEQLRREVESSNKNNNYLKSKPGSSSVNSNKSSSSTSVKYIRPCKDIRRPWRTNSKMDGSNDDDDEDEKLAMLGKKFSKRNLQQSGDANDENYRKTTDIDLPNGVDHAVVTLFADSEKGILVHEKRIDLHGKFLVGIQVPHIYLAENGSAQHSSTVGGNQQRSSIPQNSLKIRIDEQVIPEFDGVEDEHKEGRAALMKYVYHTLFNDIDGALRAIRFIKNEKIYSNMVRNCVKTRRMDVALLSLSKMKEARMAREVRNAMETEPQPQTHVAMLAIQLGMIEEAENLYRECNRYDLLLELYVASELWEKAIKLCESHRRIQLRSTYHSHGKSLEYDKKIPEAIEMYEKAETHRYEVPRMLVDNPDQLQAYILKRKDKDLYLWWAQYLESTGDIESSLRYYELAHDWLSLVRLLCYLGSYEKAVQVANKVEDKASAYHLARTLEDNGELLKAIQFFSRAQAYGHAVRMCISNNLMDELWSLALKASPSEQVDAAKYFETVEPPYFDRAIQLYHKAGYQSKALDLAFSSQEFSALQKIVRDIMNQPNMNTDPLLLQKCAEFFVQNDEIDKALDMLCAAHKYPEAMDLCVHNNFTITDEIAERLTAPKGVGLDEHTRVGLLEKMGACCTIQGSYHLAAKKYTQAGNKIEAIKSLVKSGDTERIIFYANVSRHRDIYMIAAHYLQTTTTDWRTNPKIVQTIVQYYTKAQAFESLAGFYETVAESEIEHSRDYKKALEEYRKAVKSWNDLLACGARQYEDRCRTVEEKINFIGKFLKIKDTLHFDSEVALNDLRKLIEDPRSTTSGGVRPGDVYGLIVEHYVKEGEMETAISVLEKMQKFTDGKSLTHFLSPETTAKVEHALENSDMLKRIRSGGKPTAQAGSSQQRQVNKSKLSNKNPPATSKNLLPFLTTDENQNEKDDESSEDESDGVEEVVEDNDEAIEIEEEEEIDDSNDEDDDDEEGEDEILYTDSDVKKSDTQTRSLFDARPPQAQRSYQFK